MARLDRAGHGCDFRIVLRRLRGLAADDGLVQHGLDRSRVNALGLGEQPVGLLIVAGSLLDQRLFSKLTGLSVLAAGAVRLVQLFRHPILHGYDQRSDDDLPGSIEPIA